MRSMIASATIGTVLVVTGNRLGASSSGAHTGCRFDRVKKMTLPADVAPRAAKNDSG